MLILGLESRTAKRRGPSAALFAPAGRTANALSAERSAATPRYKCAQQGRRFLTDGLTRLADRLSSTMSGASRRRSLLVFVGPIDETWLSRILLLGL